MAEKRCVLLWQNRVAGEKYLHWRQIVLYNQYFVCVEFVTCSLQNHILFEEKLYGVLKKLVKILVLIYIYIFAAYTLQIAYKAFGFILIVIHA